MLQIELNTAKGIALELLKTNAVQLSPDKLFTWASGIKSPIYCDNRRLLSYPESRSIIKDAFVRILTEKYSQADIIVGVATGGIAIGALAADVLQKPFAYVRSESKNHGMGNRIEGIVRQGQKVVVIEDLVSTGGSSIAAVEALREAGCEVLGMVAIFTYGLPIALENFEKNNCNLTTLSNYEILIEEAHSFKYVNHGDMEILRQWKSQF
jgi:orotate phosphoribosyltransferase